MHCTSQYTKNTNNIISNYLILHIFGAFSSQKIPFFTEKSGIPPESSGIPPKSSGIPPGISGIPFFKFEFTFRSENTEFGGNSSEIPIPDKAGICVENEKVIPALRSNSFRHSASRPGAHL